MAAVGAFVLSTGLAVVAGLLGLPREWLLDEAECAALDGFASPQGVFVPPIAP